MQLTAKQQAIVDGVGDHSLTLVLASRGVGATTAAMHWAQQAPGVTAWICSQVAEAGRMRDLLDRLEPDVISPGFAETVLINARDAAMRLHNYPYRYDSLVVDNAECYSDADWAAICGLREPQAKMLVICCADRATNWFRELWTAKLPTMATLRLTIGVLDSPLMSEDRLRQIVHTAFNNATGNREVAVSAALFGDLPPA